MLGAVPNFSEGRDPALVAALVDALSRPGTELLDHSSDPDHHRSVATVVGDPAAVEDACLFAAELARDSIDLRGHSGAHPRVGSLDVLPFLPLREMEMADAVESAHRVGRRIAGLGVPVYYYAQASDPPGRGLAEIRRGGFEALAGGFSSGREPDLQSPAGGPRRAPHPSAGVTCVAARAPLLAWNVYLEGLDLAAAREIASLIRETGGGFAGLRALGIALPSTGRIQVSMNLEDAESRSAAPIYDEIEKLATRRGGRPVEVEVIGMATRGLAHLADSGRLYAPGLGPERVLADRLFEQGTGGSGPNEQSHFPSGVERSPDLGARLSSGRAADLALRKAAR
ncbi:MAG: glutamate formiminotransferase [Gemmatimonadetes bacterium]|nr:glutamate formiminotransferase [Gemmatimonadota bacterium]